MTADAVNPYLTGLGYPIHYPFLLIDFLLIIYASYSLLQTKIRRYIYATLPAAFVFIWLITGYHFGLKELNSYVLTGFSLLITINYLVVLYSSEVGRGSNKLSVRLLCFSFIVYHCGTFPLFTLIKLLINSRINITIIDINTALDTTKYLLIAISLLLLKGNNSSVSLTPEYE
ncbi:hypothetical protein CJD36_018695 [Flavipsychrobacter stenotrophus]|uniref:Uncharacterized protein n=2 Tax=Flavipsychrobacter stenotrophus TaxID=2077091 RepID=A0A2S7SQU3_9BACT|nr:hypothetical protein CJD36_018695 [Flavipsychrobacter stenotrophus]